MEHVVISNMSMTLLLIMMLTFGDIYFVAKIKNRAIIARNESNIFAIFIRMTKRLHIHFCVQRVEDKEN